MHQNSSISLSREHLTGTLNSLVKLSPSLYSERYAGVFTEIPFLFTNHDIYFIEISDFVFLWTTWNTRGRSFSL